MSTTLDAGAGLLPEGTITFYDSSRAPLPAATYTLEVKQSVDLGPEHDAPPDYVAQRTLQVTAPRFGINPQELQSVFPPGNQSGNFAEALPHVVLSRDLPWARPIVVDDPSDQTPWLALLVVYESEADKLSGPTTKTVADLLDSSGGVVVPDLGTLSTAELALPVQLMKVDLSLFLSIAPKLGELPYLTHAREVDTEQKVTALAEGFWSVVIGNRLPDSSPDEPRRSTVYLISVEGHADHLAGSSVQGNQIALAVLAQWSYSVSAFPGDFLSLLQSIKTNGQDQVLRMRSTSAPSNTAAQQQAAKALDIGFVPMQAELIEGEQSTVWYRGPLTAWPNREDPLDTQYPISDHAIRYDKDYGVFDFSYAAAWQIGRLLALSDASFVQAMQTWRQALARWQQQKHEDELIRANLGIGGEDQALPLARRAKQRTASLLHAKLAPLVQQGRVPKRRRRRALVGAKSADLPSPEQLRAAVEAGEDPLQLVLGHLDRIRAGKSQ